MRSQRLFVYVIKSEKKKKKKVVLCVKMFKKEANVARNVCTQMENNSNIGLIM